MAKKVFIKAFSFVICSVMTVMALAGCTGTDDTLKNNEGWNSMGENYNDAEMLKLTLDESITYQTVESFGASGAWWSQDVGGWSETNDNGTELREEIATLLFDSENGIGLTAYRYNVGGGTADSGASFDGITDVWRRAESFEVEPGVYDWTKDENAVWFLTKAKDMGVEEIVFFCNSPIERLTKNGKGFGDATDGDESTSNLPRENYRAFSEYVMDVVEHFVSEGYPVKYISPINEPQWEWTGGQEGCHYEPEEMVEFLNVFLDVMEERNIEDVELSAPELGEWGNTSYPYYEALFADERLKASIKTLDVHSYWSDSSSKEQFLNWLNGKGINDIELKMSEWCEMVNGKDTTMDSAINLALEINTDMTKLNVTSWQYWIAVSCYNYRDGLIYVNKSTKDVWETKRLWAMGNYSRFVRPGYTRVECSVDSSLLPVSAYKGTDENGKENLVIVAVNGMVGDYSLDITSLEGWSGGSVYVTDSNHSLEKTQDIDNESKSVTIPAMSVVTVTLCNED